jgi:hypothetical protein
MAVCEGETSPASRFRLLGDACSPAETAHFHQADDQLLARFDFAKTSLVLSSSGRKDIKHARNDASLDNPRSGKVSKEIRDFAKNTHPENKSGISQRTLRFFKVIRLRDKAWAPPETTTAVKNQ